MIDWQSVDTVLLDMDGTLLDLQFDNWFWQQHVPDCYAREKGLEQTEANRIIHDWITSHQGTLNWYCLDFWTAELGLEIAGLKEPLATASPCGREQKPFCKSFRPRTSK